VTRALIALNRRTFASLRHRNYRLFFAGQVVSLAGSWMQNTALAWMVIELTHSPVAVGFLVFCRFLPFTVLGLVAGAVADRVDNRRLVMGALAVQMLVSGALTALAFSGHAEAWHLYTLALLGGAAVVFEAPGRHALTFQMVGRRELPNAIALNSGLLNGARVVGPAFAGAIIAGGGVSWCFALNTLSFLAVLAGLWRMRVDELVPLDRADEAPSLVRAVREGLAYARGSRDVRLVLWLTAVISTVGFNFNVLVPVLAADTLGAGPEVFGLISAAFGAGALAGALTVAALRRASFAWLFGGTVGFSVALLAIAPIRNVAAAAALLFAVGVFYTLWSANSNAILQLSAPDHLRGRVLSIYLFAFVGLAPLGGLLAGWLADAGGTALAFSVAGGVSLAASVAAATELSDRPLLRVPLRLPGRP